MRTSDVGFGAHILVKGNFSASHLLISGMSELCIEKDTFISDFLIGENSAGGQLTCNGNLHVKYAFLNGFNFYLKGSLDGILYVDDYRGNASISESEAEKEISVVNISDIHCINSKELDGIDDDDINDDEFERLVRKYTIFEDNYLMGGSDFLPYILKGEKIFRDIDIQLLLQDSNGD